MTMYVRIMGVALCMVLATTTAHADDAEAETWDVTVSLGGNLTDGNSETLGANASVSAARDYEKVAVRLGLEGNYGETTTTADDGAESTETTTQNVQAKANLKRTFGAPFLYWDTTALHDDPAGLDLRLVTGVGAGAFLLKRDATQLSAEAGLSYITEELKVGEGEDGAALRVAARFEHDLSDTAKTWAQVEYLPLLEDFGNYLVTAETGVEAALNNELSLRVVLQDRYDSTPTDDLEENDLALIAGLVYTL